jgi:hypothetical protein
MSCLNDSTVILGDRRFDIMGFLFAGWWIAGRRSGPRSVCTAVVGGHALIAPILISGLLRIR